MIGGTSQLPEWDGHQKEFAVGAWHAAPRRTCVQTHLFSNKTANEFKPNNLCAINGIIRPRPELSRRWERPHGRGWHGARRAAGCPHGRTYLLCACAPHNAAPLAGWGGGGCLLLSPVPPVPGPVPAPTGAHSRSLDGCKHDSYHPGLLFSLWKRIWHEPGKDSNPSVLIWHREF